MAVILFKWMLISFMNWMHPFYVGVTEIQHNPSERTLEISIKLFIDDFEKGLSDQYKTPVDLTHPKDSVLTNARLFQYIQSNLQISVNGKAVELEYVGYEKEREAAWCYVQVSGVSNIKQLSIVNTLLYNVLDQQIHIMHINATNQRKSGKIMYPDREFKAEY